MRSLRLLLLGCLLAACGFKDAPRPKNSFALDLLPPTSMTAHFRGNQLRLLAQWVAVAPPEAVILTAQEADPACGLCPPLTRFALRISPPAPDPEAAPAPPIAKEGEPIPTAKPAPPRPPLVELLQGDLSHRARLGEIQSRLGAEVEILFPRGFAGDALRGNLAFVLTPANNQGQIGSPSPAQKPREPLPLAKPQVKADLLPGCPTCDPVLPLRLQLTWKGAEPIEEGGLYRVLGLGVNFYRLPSPAKTPPLPEPAPSLQATASEPPAQGLQSETRLNSLPQHQGVFVVPHPQGVILARSVDSFGNESEPVTLYEESPAL